MTGTKGVGPHPPVRPAPFVVLPVRASAGDSGSEPRP